MITASKAAISKAKCRAKIFGGVLVWPSAGSGVDIVVNGESVVQ